MIRIFLIASYLGLVLLGFALWERYDRTPGEHRPSWEPVPPAADRRWTVSLYLHPHCPCGRASLRELSGWLAEAKSVRPLYAEVVYVRPEGVADDWMELPLERVPGFEYRCESDAEALKRRGILTSGTVVLTDSSGTVRFQGGVTPSRGQAGDGHGGCGLQLAIGDLDTLSREAPVFGCPLFNP